MSPIAQISDDLKSRLSVLLNRKIKSIRYQSIHGGSINNVYRLDVDDDLSLCCKINLSATFPGMYIAERAGLSLVESTKTIQVPKVVDCFEIHNWQVLLMEWIEPTTPDSKFWETFVTKLALLHSYNGQVYGLDHDNYMGALPQPNKHCSDWSVFFYNQRIFPQVKLAVDKALITLDQARRFERLETILPDIFADSKPVLLHGDLWSGNFLCDAANQPVLIDPAVYYGDPAVDLAMTTLFGGFANRFYEAYQYYHPLPVNHREQWDCCNLYPLLIHLNLFGKSYLGKILQILQAY